MATPSETQPIAEPPAREATISDLIATAFARYGGGFVTYGVAAILLSAIPGAAVAIARSQHARFSVFAAVLAYFASLAYLLLAGLIAADAGRRVRARLVAIAVTAPIAAIPIAAVSAALGLLALLVLPFVLAPCVLAAVSAGAGDASGLVALRHGCVLSFGALRRSVGLCAVVEVMGVLLWLGLFIALSPLAEGIRAGTAAVVWGAIYGPVSALVLRAFYGARTGRLILPRDPG